ncbi:hypothetical protein PR202_ga12603 [Eleusine coracana subsp. coracana]|uniref:Uncharacterized protein n=1 Tax=Eleusine coracana subsp. coracana TaxID=191504 RepID=A0AAV5CCK3_ELECO|nr:hypothetical protein PR202_ga12603 [Eleusine coracana subsp. coracana]
MGFGQGVVRRQAARAAGALLVLDRGKATVCVLLHVAMATTLWSEVSSTSATRSKQGGGDVVLLCRLEATAHVPAWLVLTVVAWMVRSWWSSATKEEEQGWAECS